MKLRLEPFPEPQVILNDREIVHLTDDRVKTLCGKEITEKWSTGGVPRDLCGSCRRSADGDARRKRVL